MLIYRIRSKNEYDNHALKQADIKHRRHKIICGLEQQHLDQKEPFFVKGFSITAGTEVKFLVDWLYAKGNSINWRERLICPITNLNNRQRASYHLMMTELQLYPDDVVYLSEQVTPLFHFLKTKIPNIIGSEYIASNCISGYQNENGVRHEDLTKLSFADNSVDKIISFDCLEHIPNYIGAIKDCYRALSDGGVMLVSFPFNKQSYETLVRAKVNENGELIHILEPEYHGNPFSDKGCLSYYTFGWDILDSFKEEGFSDVYAVLYWSDDFGCLGEEQILFLAKK